MKVTKLYLLIILFVLSCDKKSILSDKPIIPEPSLPPITMEGKNTFGCMVDGELFVPNDYFQYYYYSWKDNPDFYGTLSLRASRKKSNDQQGFLIQLRDRVFVTGKHHLFTNPNTSNYVRMIGYNHHDSIHFFEYTNFANDSNNYLNLMRLDTISRIASGTFQFQLINPEDNADTIKVTEGRFDVRY